MTGDSDVRGAGTLTVAAAAELRANAQFALSAARTTVMGTLSLGAAGHIDVSGSALLEVNAGHVKQAATATSAMLVVASGATLSFTAAAAASTVEGVKVQLDGSARVETGATVSVTSASGSSSEIKGDGNVTVAGHLKFDANTLVKPLVTVQGNLTVAAGVAVNFASVTMQTGARTALAFSSSTFTTINVNGTLTLSGTVEVTVPTEPTNVVVLIHSTTAIQGDFSTKVVLGASASGRRLLGSGTVVKNGNDVEYHPGSGSASPAVKAECFFGVLAALAGLML
jgi:hypothetical protein